jgi:hypothetical protein
MARSSVAARVAILAAVGAACEPTLPDTPYACATDGSCPEGFRCESTQCVREGSNVAVVRPIRVTWINASEMYWFPSKRGGATLLVNEGFTPGGRGLFEVHVSEDGTVEDPRLLLDFGEEFPTSSAVVALDDDHYGVLSLRFRTVDEDAQSLVLYRVERDREPGDDVGVDVIHEDAPPYLGGTEPVYIGAVHGSLGTDICFADPSGGGSIIVRRVDGDEVTRELEIELPDTVLPLSGDCLLWAVDDDLVVRVGLETPELYRIPAVATVSADIVGPIEVPGLPMYATSAGIVSLEVDENLAAKLGLYDEDGLALGDKAIGSFQETLEPHTGWASPGGVLFAPASPSAQFSSLDIVDIASSDFATVASVERDATDELYSARAFADGGRMYVAWTSFHEDLMDLWVTTMEQP